MSGLPPRLDEVVERVIAGARLRGRVAEVVREDLRDHFREGLRAGRSIDELLEAFGDPEAAAAHYAPDEVPVRPWWHGVLSDLGAEIVFGLRMLRRSPVPSTTAVLVLALGIASTTVVLTVVNALLLRPLPVAEPDTLVDIWADVTGGDSFAGFSYPDYLEYREGQTVVDPLVLFAGVGVRHGDEGRDDLAAQLVSDGYFDMLGLSPTLGRLDFADSEDFGRPPEIVLSHGFWVRYFGADPDILGRSHRVEGVVGTIVGVGPVGFTGHFIGFPIEAWMPLSAATAVVPGFTPDDRTAKPFEMIGRRVPGVTPESAAEVLNAIAARLEATRPETNRGHRVGVSPTTGVDHSLRPAVLVFLAILLVVATLVLVIACLNVGGILLVRSLAREREIAVRLAMGAGRVRVARQLLVESALLVAAGSVLGVHVSVQATGGVADFVREVSGGRLGFDLSVDRRVLVLSAGASLLAAVVATTAPILHLLGREPARMLRGRTGERRGTHRMRTALVVGQVGVSVVLAVATGLFVRALVEGARIDPGFAVDDIATLSVFLDPERYGPQERQALMTRLTSGLQAVPGIEAVTTSSAFPAGVARTPRAIDIPGLTPPAGQDAFTVEARTVGSGYLSALGVPLVAGREPTEADTRSGPGVAIVNRAFAERYWPDDEPLEKSIVVDGEPVAVVGVADDARHLVPDPTPDPLVYLSYAGELPPFVRVTLRGQAVPARAEEVRAALLEVIPEATETELRPGRSVFDDALFPQRVAALMVGAMGLAALLLAAIGLYGLVDFTVERSRHELGVRAALGAQGAISWRSSFVAASCSSAWARR